MMTKVWVKKNIKKMQKKIQPGSFKIDFMK